MIRFLVNTLVINKLKSDLRTIVRHLSPGGLFGRAIQLTAEEGRNIAVRVTHKMTGTLAMSHAVRRIDDLSSEIYIASLINPENQEDTQEYGPVEHDRGGDHAFYQIVAEEYGYELAAQGGVILLRGFP